MGTNKTRSLLTFPALLILATCAGTDPAQLAAGEPRVRRATAVRDSTLLSQAAQPQASPSPSPEQVAPSPTPAEHLGSNEQGDPMRNTGTTYSLDNYPLNDLFQYLATQAGLQYFHSDQLDSLKVTGQLFKGGDPLENMRELALQYNLVLYQRGRTIYAMKPEQVVNLPQQEFRYELKYLRPRDQNEVEQMLGNFLTTDHGTLIGSVTFEPKVNTIVVMDNESAVRRISTFLHTVDRPKHQISIQVRVLSINNTASKGTGIDWSNTLGPNGLSLNATAQATMNSLFGFDIFRQALAAGQSLSAPITNKNAGAGPAAGFGSPSGTSVTLGPVQVNAILRALYGNDRVSVENAPLVVTEDNEPANVSVVTRTPIVTSTVTVSNGVTNIANQVRYQIDEKDKTDPPQDRREIGTQLAVTPTILPDGTIRLLINGTVATQVGTQSVTVGSGASPNVFPIVNESHIANLARLPAGYSLILGGFINESMTEARNKVPVLGDIPLVGYAFRSKNYIKERTNLVFIITPTAYDAKSPQQAVGINEKIRQDYSMTPNSNYADPETLGHNADIYPPELRKALACPSEQEVDTNPLSERNPQNQRAVPVTTRAEQQQKKLEERYRRTVPVPQPTP
jgi:type II secretory pathway component GspD/PulD (secretin)